MTDPEVRRDIGPDRLDGHLRSHKGSHGILPGLIVLACLGIDRGDRPGGQA